MWTRQGAKIGELQQGLACLPTYCQGAERGLDHLTHQDRLRPTAHGVPAHGQSFWAGGKACTGGRRLRSLQTRMAGGAGVSIHGASGAGLEAARQWLCPTSALQHSGRHRTAMHVPYIPASRKTWIWTCFHVDVGAARLSSANQISHGDGRLHCPAAASPPGHRFQEQVPLSPVFFK